VVFKSNRPDREEDIVRAVTMTIVGAGAEGDHIDKRGEAFAGSIGRGLLTAWRKRIFAERGRTEKEKGGTQREKGDPCPFSGRPTDRTDRETGTMTSDSRAGQREDSSRRSKTGGYKRFDDESWRGEEEETVVRKEEESLRLERHAEKKSVAGPAPKESVRGGGKTEQKKSSPPVTKGTAR